MEFGLPLPPPPKEVRLSVEGARGRARMEFLDNYTLCVTRSSAEV